MSLEKAFRFLYGFKTKPNTSGWLIHSALLQRWNYICLHCQGEFLDAQQQIFILPILQWLNQLCWDGYSSFCILFLTNSSNAYVRIGAWWNATMLFWNNPKHKNQIMLALESFQWRWNVKIAFTFLLPPGQFHYDSIGNHGQLLAGYFSFQFCCKSSNAISVWPCCFRWF